jgi:putative transposase
VQRLWREEGLRVPQRRRKRRRLGDSTVPAKRLRAERPNHVWALDFQFDQTADGRILKLLHVVDEFTREALQIKCERRIDADATVRVLDRLIAERGTTPGHIRCDNGPELTANALRDWFASQKLAVPTSSRARPGRTRSLSPSARACATSCSASSCFRR